MRSAWSDAQVRDRIRTAFAARRDWMAAWEIRASARLAHLPRGRVSGAIDAMFRSGELLRVSHVEVTDAGTPFESSIAYRLFLPFAMQSRVTPFTLHGGVRAAEGGCP